MLVVPEVTDIAEVVIEIAEVLVILAVKVVPVEVVPGVTEIAEVLVPVTVTTDMSSPETETVMYCQDESQATIQVALPTGG
mmetsp:Transcript_28797/g.82377  ORF Transcript_28797/g.82377 Transcript_28797/m.82377 type:complete len:81 (+) Transcript_28797:355-597(+)